MVWFRDKLPAAPGFYEGQLSDSGKIMLVKEVSYSGKLTLVESLYKERELSAAVKTIITQECVNCM